jgi:quinol-cytochrome oxidoreductase complex cytochrome b subunit
MDLLFLNVTVLIMVGFAVMLPIVFGTLNWIEDKVEKKYGDESRKKFVYWTGYISISLLILSILGIGITIYLDPPFSSHKEHIVTPDDKPFTYYLDHKDTF